MTTSSNSRTSHALHKGSVLAAIGLVIVSFYAGLMLGLHQCQQCLHNTSNIQYSSPIDGETVSARCATHGKVQEKVAAENQSINKNSTTIDSPLEIPSSMNKLFAGMARVDRDTFASKFDIGVPLDATKPGNQDVLLLYSSKRALPDGFSKYTSGQIPNLNVKSATKHCNTLKVILTQPHEPKQCLAIMGQWESWHVHRFARFPPAPEKGGVDESNDLRYVGRVLGENGKVIERISSFTNTNQWDLMLVAYLSNLDTVLQQLKPIAASVAKNNTIVVMVCNHGQSELLVNFACAARARGLDLSQVLVFATDLETKTLASGLGLAAFYDELNYKDIPEKAARTYADRTFSRLMLAKLYCVHMINALGYDVLFQDVDVVWYRNPLDYFLEQEPPYKEFHMLFQQDGSDSRRYAPYSPNTGFYFVRHNLKTQYFLHSLLMAGNLIVGSGSHQAALNIVLQEHVSWRGLRVKVLPVDTNMFPGGFHYHRRKEFMKDVIYGKVKPYIFHMSWTTNKENKRMFMEQMGDWFVQDECIGRNASVILNETNANGETENAIAGACCMAKPTVKCHYRDKPSRIPCKDSPPIDKDKGSWW